MNYLLHTHCKNFAKKMLPEKLYEKIKEIYFQCVKRKYKRSHICIHKKTKHPFGVNLFIHNTKNSGGIVAKLLQENLIASEIPFHIIDLDNPDYFNSNHKNFPLYNVNLIVLHAASNTKYRLNLFNMNFRHHCNIGYWAWELADVPDVLCDGLDLFDEFWTISTFCTTGLAKKITVPVLTMPCHATPSNTFIENGRKYFGIQENIFLFTFVFDCMSFVERKNPKAVIDAFVKASQCVSNIGLAIKYIYPEHAKDYIHDIKCILSQFKNVFYFEKFMTPIELNSLLQISDAFVSLHRAEGFGLLPLEAMSLGTPVIATEWSGNMEYMNHKNAALVGCSMSPVNGQYIGSTPGDGLMWAEPDVDEAADYMCRMVTDKSWRDSLIAHGLHTAKIHSADKTGVLMRNRLTFLGLSNENKSRP